jgi:hypothetical protein
VENNPAGHRAYSFQLGKLQLLESKSNHSEWLFLVVISTLDAAPSRNQSSKWDFSNDDTGWGRADVSIEFPLMDHGLAQVLRAGAPLGMP